MSDEKPGRAASVGPPPRQSPDDSEPDLAVGDDGPDDSVASEAGGRRPGRVAIGARWDAEPEPAEDEPDRTGRSDRPAPEPPRPAATDTNRRGTVQLPHRIIEQLREASSGEKTYVEVITEAFLAYEDDVRDQLADAEEVRRRREVGLPAPRRKPPSVRAGQPRGQITLYGPVRTFEVLDEAARDLDISRSHLIEELLQRHLGAGQGARGRVGRGHRRGQR